MPIGIVSDGSDKVKCENKIIAINFDEVSNKDFLDALHIVLNYIIAQNKLKRKRMILSQKSIDEFKEIFEKEYEKKLSDAEASESAHNLVNFFDLLWQISVKEAKRKHRLKTEPEGFPIDGHYSCLVCGRSIDPENGWYDKWGQKCLLCTNAVKNGVIPSFVCKDHNSHYKTWELKNKFKIHPQTARKLVRTGELKARIVTTEDGKPYEYIFLKKENPEFVDPERHTSARKSYNRHRDKENDRRTRELKNENSFTKKSKTPVYNGR